MEKLSITYNKLLYMSTQGDSYFSAFTNNKIPYESNYPTILCAGKVPEYKAHYPLTIYGNWKKNNDNKWKFIVDHFEEDIKSGKMMIEFLRIEGVGEASAKKLADPKLNLWDLIKTPTALYDLEEKTHLSTETCLNVIKLLSEKKERYDLYCYLQIYGITDLKVDKLIAEYGVNALKCLKENPFKVLAPYHVSFNIMDEIAFWEGMSYNDPNRLKGILYAAMKYLAGDGSTYADLSALQQKINQIALNSLYAMPILPLMIATTLSQAKDWIYIESMQHVYFKDIWTKENDIANGVWRLINDSTLLPFKDSNVNSIEEELDITYSPEQKEAFKILQSTGIKILTGGPGTGKTTVINGIIKCYKSMNPDGKIALCAPTGMASEHMAETTSMAASTIHRLLDYRPFDGEDASYKDLNDPVDADLIIMDEVSMCDTKLMGMFLNAIKPGALVILSGDEDQLDSVGHGAVLRDLILSGQIPVYRLSTLFRQLQDSSIAYNAQSIRKGLTDIKTGKDFNVIHFEKESEIENILKKQFGRITLDDIKDIQVLSTTIRGLAGTNAFNYFIQRNVKYAPGREIHRNGFVFHAGDRIMTIKNNYKAHYFNGDIGHILSITEMGTMTIQIQNKTIVMDNKWLEDIVPAYGITVHKSQGSEFKHVIILLPQNPNILLSRSIIYTAITRAKKSVTILTQGNALEKAIMNDKKMNKQTGLVEKIKAKKIKALS